jgi:hypothetical protein
MGQERKLPQFWLLRRLRRWIVKPQKEIARWQRRLKSFPLVVLPKFLRESKFLLDLLLELRPDIVLGNARSGSPYVQVIEHKLKEAGIEVRYERLCSAWGHKLHFSLKPAASVTGFIWLWQTKSASSWLMSRASHFPTHNGLWVVSSFGFTTKQ